MSSHREAPEISKDPVADSTDLYAFVSPDRPEYVTIIANYIPLEEPAGGPNFYEFGDGVLYEINIDNDGDGEPDVTYEFRFETVIANQDTFLYNTGPITSLASASWNRRQTYTLSRVSCGSSTILGEGFSCPPCNIGPLSTPDYASLAGEAVHPLPGGGQVFAGQRAEGFYVDLGAVFDLGDLRPLAAAHNTFGIPGLHLSSGPGVNATKAVNVHSLAVQVPISDLTRSRSVPRNATDGAAVIGVWTTARRHAVIVRSERDDEEVETGPFVQISRLGNPLFNEVLVPMSQKDYWNRQPPASDKQFAGGVAHPELAQLLPSCTRVPFPTSTNSTSPGHPGPTCSRFS
jgi:hypothetical protein